MYPAGQYPAYVPLEESKSDPKITWKKQLKIKSISQNHSVGKDHQVQPLGKVYISKRDRYFFTGFC